MKKESWLTQQANECARLVFRRRLFLYRVAVLGLVQIRPGQRAIKEFAVEGGDEFTSGPSTSKSSASLIAGVRSTVTQ